MGVACPGWYFQADGTRRRIGVYGDAVELPHAVQEFISLFDKRAYPELIL